MSHMRDDALSHCARLRDLILHHSGGWADIDSLGKFHQLSYAAARDAEDADCAELMRTAQGYASDLYSTGAHERWAVGETSGPDFLRLQILRALDVFRDRVFHLQLASRTRRERRVRRNLRA